MEKENNTENWKMQLKNTKHSAIIQISENQCHILWIIIKVKWLCKFAPDFTPLYSISFKSFENFLLISQTNLISAIQNSFKMNRRNRWHTKFLSAFPYCHTLHESFQKLSQLPFRFQRSKVPYPYANL